MVDAASLMRQCSPRVGQGVLIVAAKRGWHERRLANAFARHALETTHASLNAIDFSAIDRPGASGLLVDGEPLRLPRLCLVRGIAAGSFEQVTRRLDVLYAMEMAGVEVMNSPRHIERTVDKGMASHLLHLAGVRTPPAWTTESASQARTIVEAETTAGHLVVSKPLFGSQGRGLRLLRTADELPGDEDANGVWYLQRFVGVATGPWVDWRVFVVGRDVVGAMERRADQWITNRARGATCSAVTAEPVIRELAIAAVDALQCGYAGVDIVRDANGCHWVLEVNGVPAWWGLQQVCEVDIAAKLANFAVCRARG